MGSSPALVEDMDVEEREKWGDVQQKLTIEVIRKNIVS